MPPLPFPRRGAKEDASFVIKGGLGATVPLVNLSRRKYRLSEASGLTHKMPGQNDNEPAFPFLDKVEKKTLKKKGFISQVKEFMKITQGGAIPQPLACKILGISRQRMHQLIKKEKEQPGTGIRAYRFSAMPNVVLINAEDVDRHHARQQEYKKEGKVAPTPVRDTAEAV